MFERIYAGACAGTCVEARILQGEEGFRMRTKSRKKERNNCVPGRFLYFCSQEKWLARLRRRTRTRTEEAIPLPLPLLRASGVFLIIICRKNGEAITKALPSLDAQTTTRLNSTARNHRKRTRTDRAGKDAATTEIRTTGRSL